MKIFTNIDQLTILPLDSNTGNLVTCIAVCTSAVLTTLGESFGDTEDFEGWNCGRITTCGEFGHICGGYKTKGKGSSLQKTYNGLGGGLFSVELDFIKIDSWLVPVMRVAFNSLLHALFETTSRYIDPMI